MYLARLTLNRSRVAVLWASNPYRIHQRLMMAYAGDPRVLYRLEDRDDGTRIVVQAHRPGDWQAAFGDLQVLARPPEEKQIALQLVAGRPYRFRLLANPTVKRKGQDGRPIRMGLMNEQDQLAWLCRKLGEADVVVEDCRIDPLGLQKSHRNRVVDPNLHTHYAVQFTGVLRADHPTRLLEAMERGFGSAKAYGFGLLELGPVL